MKQNLIKPIIVSLLLIYFFLLPTIGHSDNIKITQEIHELIETRTRIIWQYNLFKMIIINKLNSHKPNVFLFGFSSPHLFIGPAYSFGLFRELYNPLGYSIDSYIFKEKSDLKLKSSFNYNQRNYFFFKLNPNLKGNNILGLYYIERKKRPLALGALLRISFDSQFYTELLFQLSEPETGSLTEKWFSISKHYPGGMINHSGVRTHIDCNFLSIYLSFYISGGELLLPGLFTHFKVSSCIGWFKPQVFFGFSSKDYITPEGDRKNSIIKFAGQGELTPGKGFSILAGYEMQIDQRTSLPNKYLPLKEKLYGTIKYKQEVMKDLTFNLSTSLENTTQFEKNNKKADIDNIILLSEIKTETICFKTKISFKYDPGFTMQIAPHLGVTIGKHNISGGLSIYDNKNIPITGRFTYNYIEADYKLYIKLFYIKPLIPESLRFSFGFEV